MNAENVSIHCLFIKPALLTFPYFISRSAVRHPPFLSDEDHALHGGGGGGSKTCCGVLVTQTVSIRWFIVMIAFVGICCSIVGTVLGALKASGREHLTVSLLMIGKLSLSFYT